MPQNKNISAYSIIDFSQCKYKSWLDFVDKPKNYPQNIDPWLEIIRKIGNEHEYSYLEDLKKSENVYEINPKLDFKQKEKETDEAIKRGEKYIYQPFLKFSNFTGSPDFLIKNKNLYEPVDIKSAFKMKPENIIQICHYSFILEKKYNILPKFGKIILRDRSIEKIEIDKFYDYFKNINSRIRSFILDSNEQPKAEKCGLCSVCEYKVYCENNWKNTDNLNQVANISKKQINILEKNNVSTMKKLSELDAETQIKGINKDSLGILIDQSKLQKDYLDKNELSYKIIFDIKKKMNDPSKTIGFELLPKPDNADLFFDIEGYPMYYDSSEKSSGLEYLFGVFYKSFDKYFFKKFLATNYVEEKKAFEDLIDFFYSHLKVNKNAHIYHYNSYEETALKKLSQKYETKIFEVDFILRENKLVDLYKVVKDSVILSSENYRLKTIEKFYKLDREEDIASGQDSLVAFEKYLDSGHKEILDEIIKYNEQDCKSLIYLQEWLISIKPDEIDSSEKIEEENISENSLERIKEELEIKDYIKNINNETEDVIKILEELNFYNKKEQRSDWWSHFSNLQKDTEDLIEDTNCLGGLRKISEVESGPYKIINCNYPDQITKMRDGEYVLDQTGSNRVLITQISYSKNEVTLRIRKDKPVPFSLTPQTPLNTRAIDSAVADFIKGYDFTNSYPAIKQFLRREKTKLKNDIKIDERSSKELIEIIKSMNNSYLVLQGPPGTGKTYTSSRIIVDLLRNNFKIAIVCHSHKAIINLVEAIDSYSSEIGYEFRGAYNPGSRKQDLEFKNIEVTNTSKIDSKSYDLIAGTAWALSNQVHRKNSEKEKNFDYIFFDEAGQLSISKLIASSMSSKNIVMIGDHMQLPQPTAGNLDGESTYSPIEYLLKEKNTISDHNGIFLDRTFRMHQNICDFISKSFYENRLISDQTTHNQQVILQDGKSVENGIYLTDLDHNDYSVQNMEEVKYIKKIYDKLILGNWIDREKKVSEISAEDILVVSPFNAQVNLIKQSLGENALVGTIDNFQGQEAPIVIISYVSSNPNNIPRGSDFFFDYRRLNVSLSRAKCLAIIILNKELLDYHCNTIEDMERVNYFCKLKSFEKNFLK